jgi:hypothetical protein
MHADDAAGHARAGLDLGDRDPGGVGGEHAIVGHLHLDLSKNLDLEFKVFGHRLDHEIGARDRVRQTLVDRDLAAAMVGDRERR